MSDLDILLRLIIATFLGGIIGYEREKFHKPAGLRTHIFVSMGAALFTIIAVLSANDLSSTIMFDPSRMLASIITGVGFIGAGVIIHRDDHHVEGITTAASLWVSAAIGTAVGMGYYLISVNAVLLSLVVLLGMSKLKQR